MQYLHSCAKQRCYLHISLKSNVESSLSTPMENHRCLKHVFRSGTETTKLLDSVLGGAAGQPSQNPIKSLSEAANRKSSRASEVWKDPNHTGCAAPELPEKSSSTKLTSWFMLEIFAYHKIPHRFLLGWFNMDVSRSHQNKHFMGHTILMVSFSGALFYQHPLDDLGIHFSIPYVRWCPSSWTRSVGEHKYYISTI